MYAVVTAFPSFGSRDEFVGNRYVIQSEHRTKDEAVAALNARFDAMTEGDFVDAEYDIYVATVEAPWQRLVTFGAYAEGETRDDVPF